MPLGIFIRMQDSLTVILGAPGKAACAAAGDKSGWATQEVFAIAKTRGKAMYKHYRI